MTVFKVASWNVNSLRVRLPHVLTWLATTQPDILALQETKLADAEFPMNELKQLGYHVISSGQKSYNGVAILSREEVHDVVFDLPGKEDPQRRVLGCLHDDVRFLNLYVPNGEHIFSKKYEYKLAWLKDLDVFLKAELQKHPKMIVVGDFNIAPQEIDVYDSKKWRNHVLFSEPERKAFSEVLELGFIDSFRHFTKEAQHYTWWDYRLGAHKRNHGLRIDHILISKDLLKNCISCIIDVLPRSWERPSDHAPIVAEFEF